MADGSSGLLIGQQDLISVPPEHDEARLRYYCVDRTPLGVIRQGVRWAIDRHISTRVRRPVILDCSAGEGGFHAVLKQIYPRSHRVAVEPRAECEEHLRRHAHEVIIGGFLDHEMKVRADVPKAHIVAANPPFADPEENPLWMHFWRACASHLLPGGVVVLLGLNELGQRGKRDHAGFKLLPPSDQGRIAGPIKFRGWRRGADMRCYSWWVKPEKQRRRADDSAWRTENLAWLPKEDREWKTIPGHEP